MSALVGIHSKLCYTCTLLMLQTVCMLLLVVNTNTSEIKESKTYKWTYSGFFIIILFFHLHYVTCVRRSVKVVKHPIILSV